MPLPASSPPKKRTIAYIDGLNLYHALHDLKKPHLKWLNLWSLCESLLRKDDKLIEVNYYTTYAAWIPGAYHRHLAYVQALKAVGVNTVLGQFKDKHIKCHKCGQQFKTKEEKRTDINIAMGLVVGGMQNRYDRAILISADSDLGAALDAVRELEPDKEILVVAPPKRIRRARDLGSTFELNPSRIARHLLAPTYRDDQGQMIVRPVQYDPPSPP